MDIHPVTILAMVDRIVQAATEDELKTNVEGFRRTLHGTMPSVVLKHLVVRDDALNQEVADLTAEKADLEAKVADLNARLRQLAESSGPGAAENGFYTMEQFLAVLTIKLRRSYGWRIDYVTASQQTDGCTPVKNETVQKWQNSNQVPDWAVTQIDKLEFRKRSGTGGPAWTDENENYLSELYKDDPHQTNLALAKLCEQHFGRPLNENSIKGAIDRLRKRGQLPEKRPTRLKS